MTLHALLSATEPTEDGAGLRAARLVAGQHLIERQAGLCRAAGAVQIFVCVETMSDALVTAFDRLRATGIAVEPVRRASEIGDRTHPHDDLLLLLDGLYMPGDQLAAYAAGVAPSVFVTDDSPVTRGLERIDADRRWAGLAKTRCGLLADLADVPDDWDLASTVLRRIVQRGAAPLPCDPALFERGDMVVVDSDAAADALSERVYDSAGVGEHGVTMANLLAPLARFAGPLLLRRSARAATLDYLAGLLLLVAALGWASGWIVAGAASGLAGLLVVALARYVGLFTREPPPPRWRAWLLRVLPGAAILGWAARAAAGGEGWALPSLLLVAALALGQAGLAARRGLPVAAARLLPDAGMIFALGGMAAILADPARGIAVLALASTALLMLAALVEHRTTATGFIPN